LSRAIQLVEDFVKSFSAAYRSNPTWKLLAKLRDDCKLPDIPLTFTMPHPDSMGEVLAKAILGEYNAQPACFTVKDPPELKEMNEKEQVLALVKSMFPNLPAKTESMRIPLPDDFFFPDTCMQCDFPCPNLKPCCSCGAKSFCSDKCK